MPCVQCAMFIGIIVFIVSLIAEIAILFFLSPKDTSGALNHLSIFLLSLNTGILLGSLYLLLLFLTYWLIKAYDDIKKKLFVRRSVLLGLFVFITLMLRMYSILDVYILFGLAVTFIAIEVIASQKM